uniref:hypothetical protein n=1 Tax=Algoriphagus sp. TaxID=1872435 RepID=UPI00404822C4
MYGDILEAFLGAVYLDRGYGFSKKLILQRILIHLDLEEMVEVNFVGEEYAACYVLISTFVFQPNLP